MKPSPWLGIGVGTLIASLGVWFGLIAIQSNRTIGVSILAVGIVFSMYGMSAFSGIDDPATVAFNSAIYTLTTATTMVVLFTVTESASYAVAAPVLAIGVGGSVALPPQGTPFRTLARLAAAVAVTVVAILVYWVDHTVYALIAPLMPLPAVGLADRFFSRGSAIVAE